MRSIVKKGFDSDLDPTTAFGGNLTATSNTGPIFVFLLWIIGLLEVVCMSHPILPVPYRRGSRNMPFSNSLYENCIGAQSDPLNIIWKTCEVFVHTSRSKSPCNVSLVRSGVVVVENSDGTTMVSDCCPQLQVSLYF